MTERINPPLPSRSHERTRQLRGSMTDTENKLWFHLRAARLNGLKFRRQHPVPPYVVDFICVAEAMVVELDGSQHEQDVDAVRTKFLEAQGLRVLRFWDNDVLRDTDAVLDAILNAVGGRTRSPTPHPLGEGL